MQGSVQFKSQSAFKMKGWSSWEVHQQTAGAQLSLR